MLTLHVSSKASELLLFGDYFGSSTVKQSSVNVGIICMLLLYVVCCDC